MRNLIGRYCLMVAIAIGMFSCASGSEDADDMNEAVNEESEGLSDEDVENALDNLEDENIDDTELSNEANLDDEEDFADEASENLEENIEEYSLDDEASEPVDQLVDEQVGEITDEIPTEVEEEVPVLADESEGLDDAPSEELVDDAPVRSSMGSGEGRYVVQPGDTLARISQVVYGDAGRWRELADQNSISNVRKIFPGDVLSFSTDSQAAQDYAARMDAATQSVVVEKGDSLWSISERLFGSGTAWRYLWRFNEAEVSDPDRIFVGQTLRYADMSSDAMAGDSGSMEGHTGH